MEFFEKIINFIKVINLKYTKFKYRKYLIRSNCVNGIKSAEGKDYSLRFDCAFKDKKKEVLQKVEHIVKKAKNNPYKLLSYIEKHGTKIYKIKNADKILSLVNETEGFITPKKGIKAIYLNLMILKRFSLSFAECFIMRNLQPDPYCTIHQFYTWYAFKSGFAGYDYKTQEKFHSVVFAKNRESVIDKLSVSEILSVKEAIHRDVEALEFVINISKKTDGAKSAYKKMLLATEPVNV